jgi:tetratricopeptide (TPR) repeat protein
MKSDEVIGLLKAAKVEEALEAADKVEDRVEMAERLAEFAGTLNLLKGLPTLTEVLLEKALELDPLSPRAHYNLGVLYSSEDQLEEDEAVKLKLAELEYGLALKYKPDYHEARYNLALLFFFLGRLEEARKEYAKIRAALGDDERYRDLGIMLLDAKRRGL